VSSIQLKQAEAAVASRDAARIRAKKAAQDAQDVLRRLLSGPEVNLLSDARIVPTTELFHEKFKKDVPGQLLLALEHSPVLAQARQAIAVAAINVKIAENQALPAIDISASTSVHGRDRHRHEAKENLGTLDYVSYMIQLAAEYPLGNRERRADLRKAKFTRLQAVARMQETADLVAAQVKERIRQINASYEEIAAQTKAVEAAEAKLKAVLARAKQVEEGRSPTFLDLILNSQQAVAGAKQELVRAKVEYNNAIVQLYQVTGTTMDHCQVGLAQVVQELLPVLTGEKPWPDEK